MNLILAYKRICPDCYSTMTYLRRGEIYPIWYCNWCIDEAENRSVEEERRIYWSNQPQESWSFEWPSSFSDMILESQRDT